jgi:two-component sensor histidine kinase
MTQIVETMSDTRADDLRTLMHRLNNQLGVIIAHAELLEAKSTDDRHRERATQVVTAALQAMSLAREIRSTLSEND